VASGAYINRMSNHCRGCHYDVKQTTGAKSCPMNALYWHFLDRHRLQLAANPRMAQMYCTWEKMAPAKQQALLATAHATLRRLDRGEPV
jgi:deoxyribodipyrimidine photolyase-related protein